MAKIIIDHDRCDGENCEECADVCPMEVLILDGDKIIIQNMDECSLCESCVDVCPNDALKIEED